MEQQGSSDVKVRREGGEGNGGQGGQRTSCDCLPSFGGFKNSLCSSDSSTKASAAVGRSVGRAEEHAAQRCNSASFMQTRERCEAAWLAGGGEGGALVMDVGVAEVAPTSRRTVVSSLQHAVPGVLLFTYDH